MGLKKSATKFEEKIKQFLQNLEFNDVDGARDDFLINGIQVDVVGGWDNALLVIECKTKQKLGKKSLRQAINELRGKIPLLEEGFKRHPKYKKYSFFKYIIVTKNIKVRRVDYEFAKKHPSIYIWNDDFLKYYSDLYGFIKPYAKYDLLGEMKIRPVQQYPITVPAFRIKFDNINVYNFVMNPKDLLEVAFVARREVGKERYYQRIIDKKRLLKIAKYIEEGGKFPNNIIIAFKEGLNIKFHRQQGPEYNNVSWPFIGIEYGILEFPKDYRSCWIIDGQHRLYAFIHVKKNFYFNMPITAFENLSIEQQRKFFLDINKNQKAVDPDLLWDLSGDIPHEIEGKISNVVKYLNNEENGPLFFKIYYPSTGIRDKKGKIKISALCTAIKKRKLVDEFTLENIKNLLYDKDYEKCILNVAKALSKFFKILSEEFPINWKLGSKGFILTNGGISVMIGLYEKILSRIIQKEKRLPRDEEIRRYVTPIKEELESTDAKYLKNLRLRCTSEGGKSELLTEFILKIRKEIGDELFGGEIQTIHFNKEFQELEKKIKSLIKQKLYDKNNENWFKDMVDKDIYEKAVKRMKKKGIKDMKKIHLQLTLGDCFRVIKKHKKLFYPFFINEENEFSFDNERELEAVFDKISIMRSNLEAHYTGAKIKIGDEEILKIYLERINKCLDKALKS